MNKLGIYIHIPFCEKKCNYCSFVSFCADSFTMQNYFDSMVKEITSKHDQFKDYEVVSIYFGGGTPSIAQTTDIELILQYIRNYYNVSEDVEITFEGNPNSLDAEELSLLRFLGVNRLSIGVQSLCDKQLQKLGRPHDKKQAINIIKQAKQAGFDNISVDFLLGIEGQSAQQICEYSNEVLKLGVKHISAYMLIVEDGTPIKRMIENDKYLPLGDDKTVEIYDKLLDFLKKRGMHRYEISNFAFDGYECRHNKLYWDMTQYLGFGVAAHSFYNGERHANCENLEDYIAGKFEKSCEKLTPIQLREDTVMLALRTANGISVSEYKKHFTKDELIEKTVVVKELIKQGLIKLESGFIVATDRGFEVLNQIILKLI